LAVSFDSFEAFFPAPSALSDVPDEPEAAAPPSDFADDSGFSAFRA
jgi:hypothetical protein